MTFSACAKAGQACSAVLITCPSQFISGKMHAVEPWKSQSEAEFDNAMEAMEKLVMNRLYT